MIKPVTDSIVAHLTAHTADLGTWVIVHSLSRADADPAADRLAVALYGVEEHPHLRNRPLVDSPAGFRRPPLALRLNYLMSYWGDHEEAQERLTRVVQLFHTTPILRTPDLDPALAAQVDHITIRLRTTSADERNQIWTGLGRPQRLGLFYQVDVAPIAPLEREGRGRIDEHRIAYSELTTR